MPLYIGKERVSPVIVKDSGSGADYKSSLMATTTQSAYSPSIVSLSDYVLPNYTIEKGQTGLLYPKRTTTTIVTENFTKVGDVAIEDMVASGFSGSSYLTTNNTITLGSNFEIKFTFTTGNDISTEQNIFQGRINPYIAIGVGYPASNPVYLGYNIGTGSSWLLPTAEQQNYGDNALKSNTKYYVRLIFTGSEYKSYISENGDNEKLDWTFASTQIIPSFIGSIGINRNDECHFKGSIDLSESYIKVNNEMYWQPYTTKETNEYSLNVPDLSQGFKYSSISLEGLTYTNNILKNTTYSSAGRIDTGVKLKVSADDSWEWCIRFKQTEKGGAQYIMNHDYYKTGPYLAFDSTNTLLFTVWDGSSYVAGGSITELELNNWYTVRVGSTGNSYFMQYKNDGEEWSEVSCHNATNLVALSPTTEIRIGKPSHDGLLVGEWDFSQSYIKINGEMLWPNDEQKYKGICTKDFIQQAGTNTLNAYHIEYTDGTSECLLGQTEPIGEDIKSVQLLESGLTFEEYKAWTYNEDSEQFE